jgi:hypothetical protein
MSSAIKKIAAATAVTLVAGLGLTGTPGSATAATGGFCEGQSAPANTDPSNQAPVPTNDTVNALAGTLTVIKVLANDTDPDGDRLYLENASSPRRGEICVQRNGTIEFLADGSRSNYVSTFTYGVTDGDRYRTATVTVNVQGVQPMRPTLKKRLILKKHSQKVKQRAVVSFTNPNPKRMLLLAGNPKKDNPSVQHFVYPGRTFTFSTKERRLAYITVLSPKNSDTICIVNQGLLNTRNGHLSAQYIGATISFGRAQHAEVAKKVWARR